MPRRKFLTPRLVEAAPPQMRVVAFRGSIARTFGRLWHWAIALFEMAALVVWDHLHGRGSERQHAIRLAAAFARMGGPFVKIGRRLALRSELRQSAYGEELSRLRDIMPPFPTDEAIAILERTTGKPLAETFAQFDPVPILSNSIACTYQAILVSGEKVVAKVRRPGAGDRLMADLSLFDWIAVALEVFTIVQAGYTTDVRRELREALLDELDFVREARHQTSFRRAARRSGKRFFSAPRVHFELSGDEVIVQEFVSGMWLWELLAAVEQRNEPVLDLARRLNIDPGRVARRLMWVSFWSWHENLFFLAEPNPENIILGANGTLSFIDFTATGAIDRTMRHALQQNMHYALKREPLHMARAALALIEPLPPLDVIELTKELEAANWQMLYAFETKPTDRHSLRRTTLLQWRGLLEAARSHRIVVDFSVVRLLGAAVRYETLALRLDNSINILKEYRRFTRRRADRAADCGGRDAERRAKATLDKTVYLRLERLANAGESFFFRLRHLLALPRVNFSALMSKSSFAFVTLMRFLSQLGVLTLAAMLVAVSRHALNHDSVTYLAALQSVVSSIAYRSVVVALLVINGRSLLFRLDDKDV